jgi:hypothetical protein
MKGGRAEEQEGDGGDLGDEQNHEPEVDGDAEGFGRAAVGQGGDDWFHAIPC